MRWKGVARAKSRGAGARSWRGQRLRGAQDQRTQAVALQRDRRDARAQAGRKPPRTPRRLVGFVPLVRRRSSPASVDGLRLPRALLPNLVSRGHLGSFEIALRLRIRPLDRPFADGVAVICAVGEALARCGHRVEHGGRHLAVGGLAGRRGEDSRPALGVAQGMDLSRSATAGATNRLTLLPFWGAGSRTVRLDGVQSAGNWRCVRVADQRRVDPLPDAPAGPAVEAVVDGGGRARTRMGSRTSARRTAACGRCRSGCGGRRPRRGLPACFEKTAKHHLAVVAIAATVIRLR